MRILFLCHRLPYPPNKGDKIRSLNLLRHLTAGHEVHVACPVDAAADLEHLPALQRTVATVHYSRIDGLMAKGRLAIGLATGKPMSVCAFYSRQLQEEVDALLDRLDFDCVFVFSSAMAEYCFRSRHWGGAFRRMRRLMDLIDVDSAKWSEYAARSGGWRRWIYRRESRLLADFEKKIAADFDHLFVVTDAEKLVLPPGFPVDKVSALPNGVDLAYFEPVPMNRDGAKKVVFTGVMDYWPNMEGVMWFVREIWPAVRARHPDAQFDIVGSRPDPCVKELAEVSGVNVTGFVPDVREYLAGSRVGVVPLRIARGVQNKVLEAMATARPVVCTARALEGIPAVPGTEILVADDPAAFAEEVCRLLESPEDARRLGLAARACVERNHRWDVTLAPLDSHLA